MKWVVLFFVISGASRGFANEREEFTWTHQRLECTDNAHSHLRIEMNPLRPFARVGHNYETGSAVCNFDSRSTEFVCVGFWGIRKDLVQVSVRMRAGKMTASFKASEFYGKRPLQLTCALKKTEPSGRDFLQQ